MIKTILCKNIINENTEIFKEQIKSFVMLSNGVENTMYDITKNILLEIYGNSYIRYETAENFLNALSIRFYNIAPIYQKKFDIIATTLNLENQNFIAEIKKFTESKQNIIASNQTDLRKDAETPTTIKADTDFVEKYTNNASKTTTNGQSNESGNITHSEINTADLIERLTNLEKMRSILLEKYAHEFNDLFIQFL